MKGPPTTACICCFTPDPAIPGRLLAAAARKSSTETRPPWARAGAAPASACQPRSKARTAWRRHPAHKGRRAAAIAGGDGDGGYVGSGTRGSPASPVRGAARPAVRRVEVWGCWAAVSSNSRSRGRRAAVSSDGNQDHGEDGASQGLGALDGVVLASCFRFLLLLLLLLLLSASSRTLASGGARTGWIDP
ncbi:hypothetical protein JHW43_008152 [Diplocarpon mali]|nr:hypothetical protein JHW43_008152 [Diplocarpon mali]